MSGPSKNGKQQPGRTRKPHGAAGLTASPEAKRLAATILEVLAGIRTPTDAARVLGTSIPRYYQLEQQAIHGLLMACERRPRGRQSSEAQRVVRLERDLDRLQKECGRQQALARLSQRAVGLPAPQAAPAKPPTGTGTRKTRKRRPAVRALRVVAALAGDSSSPAAAGGVQTTTASQS